MPGHGVVVDGADLVGDVDGVDDDGNDDDTPRHFQDGVGDR